MEEVFPNGSSSLAALLALPLRSTTRVLSVLGTEKSESSCSELKESPKYSVELDSAPSVAVE